MRRNMIESVMGGVVLCVAALFVFFAYRTAQIRALPGYELSAAFSKVGGLAVGSDVRISGVKVGRVVARTLDPATYEAKVVMRIDETVRVPEDSVASIASEGPLGGRYIGLAPGASATMLPDGGTIRETRAYRSLEDQVGEIIFLATSKPSGAK